MRPTESTTTRITPELPRALRALANEAGGRRRTGHTFGRAGDHRRDACCVVLTGHAPNVPYAPVPSGHSRTTTVDAHALRAAGSARPVRSKGASQARGDLVVLVRAGSVPHREPAGVGGHERSRRVWTNRRSAALQRLDLESTNRVAQSSSLPTRLPRALRPLALETVVTEDGPPLRPSREPSSPGRTIAALTGRAAHVQWRGWTKRSSPTMRAKRAAPLGADRLVHLGLQ